MHRARSRDETFLVLMEPVLAGLKYVGTESLIRLTALALIINVLSFYYIVLNLKRKNLYSFNSLHVLYYFVCLYLQGGSQYLPAVTKYI